MYDLHLLQDSVNTGTERNLQILTNIYEDLKNKVEYRFHTSVTKIEVIGDGYRLTTESDGDFTAAT